MKATDQFKIELTIAWFEEPTDSGKIFYGAKWYGSDRWGERGKATLKINSQESLQDLFNKIFNRIEKCIGMPE